MADTATVFHKFFNAQDAAGDEDFAARLRDKAVVLRKPEGIENAVRWVELSDEARAFLHILKLPRRFKDMENAGIIPQDRALAALRGLHSAELLDTAEAAKARALVPVEVRRVLAEMKGQQLVKKRLVANIYRPSLDGEAQDQGQFEAEAPGAVEPPPPPKPAEDTGFKLLKEEVEAAFAKLPKANHFEVLGLERTDGDEKIKPAYLALVRKWHPDRIGGYRGKEAEEVSEKMAKLFSAVSDAHGLLADSKMRAAYLEDLKKREMSSASAAASNRAPVRAEEAKLHAQKGRVLLKQKDYPAAEASMKKAVECDPALAEYKVDWAWAMALNPQRAEKDRRREALEVFKDVIKNTRYADAHYKLGLLFRILGESDRSEDCFRRCLQLDSKHEEAAREVRLIEKRAEKSRQAPEKPDEPPPDKGGMFGKIKKALGS